MDRRQQKSRAAIFSAFIALLERKTYSRITVQNIIDEADVGRATFYAHFETKEALLKELCEELFGHIAKSAGHLYGLYSCHPEATSAFGHLLLHLKADQGNLIRLLTGENNSIFLTYFRDSLKGLVKSQFFSGARLRNTNIPEDFLISHIAGSFVDTVLWWIRDGMKETPQEIERYFRAVTEPLL